MNKKLNFDIDLVKYVLGTSPILNGYTRQLFVTALILYLR